MRLIKKWLRFLGFDVCPHEFTRWDDMYTHHWQYSFSREQYEESRDSKIPHTYLKQQRRCLECNLIQYRRIDLKARKQ